MENQQVKASIYNEIVNASDGVVIYNYRTGKIIKIRSEHYESVRNLLEQSLTGEQMLLDEAGIQLLKEGFLIDSELDEIKEMEEVEKDAQFDQYLRLIILPTEECNFRCVYCYEHFERGKMTLETQEKVIEYVASEIANYKGLVVSWFGGEPTEAMDVVRHLSESFLVICKKNHKTYSAGMTTNGFNLTLNRVKELKKLHVTEYQITIDGLPEMHNKQRVLKNGGPTCERIIQNLLNIKNILNTCLIKIILRMNLSTSMYNQIEDILRFVDDNFGEDDRFMMYMQFVADYGYVKEESVRDLFIPIESSLDLLKKYNHRLKNSFLEQQIVPVGSICYALKRNAWVISSDGILKKCTCDLDLEENEFGRIGEEIDEEKHNKWLRRDIDPGMKCYECKVRPICHNRACHKTYDCPPQATIARDIVVKLAETKMGIPEI